MANKFDVKKEEEQQEVKKPPVYCYHCLNCDKKYHLDGRVCPFCGSNKSKVAEVKEGEKIQETRKDCFECEIFDISQDFRVYGPGCKGYGKDGVAADDKRMCQDCKCKRCCNAEKAYQRVLLAIKVNQANEHDKYLREYPDDGFKPKSGTMTPERIKEAFRIIKTAPKKLD